MFTQNIEATRRTLALLNQTDKMGAYQVSEIDLSTLVREVCSKVAPMWPLANFIAVNPLQGYESNPFSQAVEIAKKLFHAKALPDLEYFHHHYLQGRVKPSDILEVIKERKLSGTPEDLMMVLVEEVFKNASDAKQPLQEVFLLVSEWADQLKGSRLYPTMQAEITKWCASYLDRGEAAWTMPGKELGLYSAWKNLVIYDLSFERAGITGFRDYVKELPSDSLQAIKQMLKRLEVPEHHYRDYLARHLAASPGWSGMLAHLGAEQNFQHGTDKSLPLIDFLAVRLAYDSAGSCQVLGKQDLSSKPWESIMALAKQSLIEEKEAGAARFPGIGMVWLEAFEKNYRDRLFQKLRKSRELTIATEDRAVIRPQAQAVFCIDVRSEAFRRNLEYVGNYDTYGFAGFFAIPLAHQEFGSHEPSSQCPVLIRPKYLVSDEPTVKSSKEAHRYLSALENKRALEEAIHEVKDTSVSPFALVETIGGLGFVSMALRSFIPSLKWKLPTPALKTRPSLAEQSGTTNHRYVSGIPFKDQLAIAENSLRIMGLLENFARVVLLCGHGSTTTNNAYASALDCGACGGHRGAPNARIASQIFNNSQVREALAQRGIKIPEDTIFVAAEHNTATDELTFFDQESLPVTHLRDIALLKVALKEAKEFLNWERTQRFDNPAPTHYEAVKEVARRSLDWSEARPEWGLAGNAAFIVAKRSLTKGVDLESRTFLHSYDWKTDTTGSALEVIMTAPMIVAEWINTQYYFSTVDNDVFGSGNKTIHNVVGKLGVMQGNVSDLKIGLPLQSVNNGKEWVHEPMRLLSIIEAPRDRIARLVTKHESVKKLVSNEWIRLVALDPADNRFYRLSPSLEWVPERY